MMRCRTCGTTKSLDQFYAHPTYANGLDTRCKSCAKAYQRTRSRTNPAVQEYDRRRAKHPHRIELRQRVGKKWREQNPDAYRAQTALNNAKRDGRIEAQPCFFCGASERVHAHHHDYGRPLDVTWLCVQCHQRLHAYQERVSE